MTRKKNESTDLQQDLLEDSQAGLDQTKEGVAPENSPEHNDHSQDPPQTVRVEFLTNVKHDTDYYRAGQREDLPKQVFDTLLAAKAVRRLGE
ncbi:hypothetical protein D3P09_02310 [Paenibacillus pinisoli]|uniref:Uncharacterized protein n=1 Tax=Paenibacillus pinisoli TaxID=1276110 RepID=A0A3A6PNC2_9BACL|nr:hypothetical protein [Paenibacillus pinisoli]RJX40878.1 hypothetical protein D3P09_02310 [Paenibacillus pinisoli]